jgi:hypothetical protein
VRNERRRAVEELPRGVVHAVVALIPLDRFAGGRVDLDLEQAVRLPDPIGEGTGVGPE